MNKKILLAAGFSAVVVACGAAMHAVATPGSRKASAAPSARSSNDAEPVSPMRQPVGDVQLCQACEPAAPRALCGVDCVGCSECGEATWRDWRPIPWETFGPGEYVGPARLPHVPEYQLRVDDQLEMIYRLTREQSTEPYRLNVGDEIRVESMIDSKLDRDLVIQPDGSITLRLLGQMTAAQRTVEQLRDEIEAAYQKYYKEPAISVTPLKVNARLEDLRAAVDSRYGQGGQSRRVRVTPEGDVQLVGIGSVPALGLTLEELKQEIDARYAELVDGIEVTPVLEQRAPRFIYVVGEVRLPNRYVLEGPTTVTQAIALAGGWINTGNLREIVIFRRADDWRLLATRLDLRGALLGNRPCPADEIWLRDSDVVIVPKMPIAVLDDFIELVFTKGLYGALPIQGIYNLNSATVL